MLPLNLTKRTNKTQEIQILILNSTLNSTNFLINLNKFNFKYKKLNNFNSCTKKKWNKKINNFKVSKKTYLKLIKRFTKKIKDLKANFNKSKKKKLKNLPWKTKDLSNHTIKKLKSKFHFYQTKYFFLESWFLLMQNLGSKWYQISV